MFKSRNDTAEAIKERGKIDALWERLLAVLAQEERI